MTISSPHILNRYKKFEAVVSKATGFFHVAKIDDHWWLIDPEGRAFVSIALNHIDETDLKYPRNLDVWRRKYGSRERWIAAALDDLDAWGFNTLGWTQQWVTGSAGHDLDWVVPIDFGHGEGWSIAEMRAAGMPYVQNLRVAEIEGWNGNPKFPDVFSRDFD